jgi:hypothetical protein
MQVRDIRYTFENYAALVLAKSSEPERELTTEP